MVFLSSIFNTHMYMKLLNRITNIFSCRSAMASLRLYIGLFLGLAIALESVLGTPVITHISKDVVASVNDTVEFTCTVEEVGQLSVSWAKRPSESDTNSVVLSMRNILSLPDQRYNVTVTEGPKAGSATYTFRIQKIEVSDMGPYECQVLVSATEKVTKKLSLQIKTPPVIAENTPKSTVVTEGQNLELTCHANGFPKPTISWAREHNAVMPAGGHLLAEPTLRIRTVHRMDRGGYYCIAQNGEGQPDKRLIRVEVEFRPQIAVQRPKVAQMVSHSAELECSCRATPHPLWSGTETEDPCSPVGTTRWPTRPPPREPPPLCCGSRAWRRRTSGTTTATPPTSWATPMPDCISSRPSSQCPPCRRLPHIAVSIPTHKTGSPLSHLVSLFGQFASPDAACVYIINDSFN